MTPTAERRFTAATSGPVKIRMVKRARADGGEEESPILEGYAAVYFREGVAGTEYQLFDDFYERIMPGTFDEAIRRGDDALCLYNHDLNRVLGRIGAGTCRIRTDTVGLAYECDLPNTTYARDLVESLQRQDVPGSSFSFEIERADYTEEKDPATGLWRNIRCLRSVRLRDVSPTCSPAYTATSAGLRSVGEPTGALEELRLWKAERLRLEQLDLRLRLAEAEAR